MLANHLSLNDITSNIMTHGTLPLYSFKQRLTRTDSKADEIDQNPGVSQSTSFNIIIGHSKEYSLHIVVSLPYNP